LRPTTEFDRSIAELVGQRAAERPDGIALEDGERRLTYAQLYAAAGRIAAALREAGVGREEPVAVCLPRSWQAVCAMLGALRAGAAYLPIDPSHPARRQRRLIELAGTRLALTGPTYRSGLPDSVEALDAQTLALEGHEDTEGKREAGGDRLAYLLFTSGSTGEPKGVETTHANLVHLLTGGGPLVPERSDAILGVAPIEFDIAAMEIWGALSQGARLVLAPPGRPDPRAVGRLIAERRVTYAFLAAGFFAQVVRAALPDLAGMRLISTGGDVLSPGAAGTLRRAHPHVRLLNAYGPTETTIVATAFEVEAVDDQPLPIGRALPGYELRVLDSEREPVQPGDAGELWIGGPGVARGYRGDRARTADRFRPDPDSEDPAARMYGSGDLVRLREDGELLFLGRLDEQVKIAGHRVEPGEVEQALGAHPGVRQAAVLAREDLAGHKRLVAYASLQDSQGGEPELRDHLAERLPAYMLPASIEILPELPLSARGKIDRRALPAPRRRPAGGEAKGDVAAVADAMAELLGLEQVGPEEDFFSLGADSLLAIQLIGQLRERLGARVDIDAVFDGRTPQDLAAQIEIGQIDRPGRRPLRRSTATGPAPATFAQRRAWLHERMNPGSLAFQFACVLHLSGELDENALAAALGDLMSRHESLRTALVERDGELRQIVHEGLRAPLEIVDLSDEDEVAWVRLLRGRVRRRVELERAPLFRWTLVRRGPGRWSLVDVEHHAIHDGWSFMLLQEELAELYSARVEGRAAELPAPTVQLGDFARWERSLPAELERRQLDHWRRTLDPDPPLLALGSGGTVAVGGAVRRPLDPDLAARVRQLGHEEGATSFMVSLAAYALLLALVSGEEATQIGSGLANRAEPAAERIVGMIVATVALRIELSGDPSVRELLRRVRRTVLDAVANSDVPFERVVEELAPPRRSGSPLIQTLFSFDDAPDRPSEWAGLETRVVQTIPNGTAKADLNVIGVDHGDGAPFFIWEHSELLSHAEADRLAGRHQLLLERFVARPEARISQLDLLSEGERADLERWSSSGADYDRDATLVGLVDAQVRRAPEATAVVDGERLLSYRELAERARAVAAGLAERGVRRGDRVGTMLGRGADGIVAQLGVLMAGAAYVPLDPDFPAARVERVLADAGAEVALTEIDLPPLTRGAVMEPQIEAEDLAYVIYTSGSTGEPKGVEVTHRNVVRLVDDPGFAELGPGTTMLHAASPAFDAATLEVWGPLANGGTVVCMGERPSPAAIAAAIADHGVDTLWLTAGLFNELVDRRPECLAQVRQLLTGGEALSPDHVRRALEALPPHGRLTNGYGPTETTTFATTHELRPGDPVGERVPIGRPIQGTSCRVLDAREREAPVGVVGELAIGGDGVSRGYRGDPELTALRFRPDPDHPGGRLYLSGDRVRRRADGVLEFLGRADSQLKLRGHRVEPAEVERALRAHPALADAAVVPFERAPGEPALAAYVVAAGPEPPPPAALRAHLLAQLPAALVPAAYIAVPKLPLTLNGKLDRKRLPAPTHAHLAVEPGGDAPVGKAEGRVIECFERVLGVNPVGVEDDFFALGGHSLLALSLLAELERIARRRLPSSIVFEAPTPRALARSLGRDTPASRWDSLVPLKPSGSRPPLFVVAAGDGNIVGFAPLARRLSAEQPLYALQPSGLDGRRPLDRGIGAMADRYLAALRAVQPDGPYLLAGRCNGATVAFEMAQRLRAAGEEVPLLVALDSEPPPAGPSELIAGVPYDQVMEAAALRAREAGMDVPDPEAPGGGRALAEWLGEPAGGRVSRYLHEVWHWREDLRGALPDPLGADADSLAGFAWNHARHELVVPLLLPALVDGCTTPEGMAWDWAMDSVWEELSRLPANPLSRAGWPSFRQRLTEPLAGGLANRYLLGAWSRADLRRHFPDPLGEHAVALREWAWWHGVEEGLAPALLPERPLPLPLRRRIGRRLRPARSSAHTIGEQAAREARRRAADLGAEAVDALERALDRPLPGARERLGRRVMAAARQARASYRARPWPGRVVLVTSPEYDAKPAYLAWGARALAGVERRPLPVGHVDMLRNPGVGLLAECLEDCIGEALGQTR
jgi:amino acid adenylation domain-containing protein